MSFKCVLELLPEWYIFSIVSQICSFANQTQASLVLTAFSNTKERNGQVTVSRFLCLSMGHAYKTTPPPTHTHALRNVAAIFGAGVLLKWMLKQVWQLSGGFCAYFLAPWGISQINLKKYGPWAGEQASSHVFIPLLV